jgi:hypothetical protein
MSDEYWDDPCYGCSCKDDNECEDCYEKLISQLAKENELELKTCGAASFES